MTSRARKPDPLAGADARAREAEHIGRLYQHIYRVARQIPRGRVATYGQVAELAGIPGGARVVGAAMRACPPELGVPWQRVVGKRSPGMAKISILDPVGGAVQRGLLEDEGVAFTASGAIALATHGWLPRTEAEGKARPRGHTVRERRARGDTL